MPQAAAAGAEIGLAHGRIGLDVGRSAFRDLAPEIQHRDAVGHRHDEFDMVLDQQDGHAVRAQPADTAVERFDFLGIHPGRRFVEQEEGGPRGQRTREFKAPLLAESEVRRELVPLVGEVEKFERAVDLRLRLARAAEPALQEPSLRALRGGILRDPEVLPDRQLPEQPDVLECARNALRDPQVRRRRGDVGASEPHLAGGRREQTADQVDDRALARAVGADETENLALRNGEIDAVDRAHPAEMLGQCLELKHWRVPCCAEHCRARD